MPAGRERKIIALDVKLLQLGRHVAERGGKLLAHEEGIDPARVARDQPVTRLGKQTIPAQQRCTEIVAATPGMDGRVFHHELDGRREFRVVLDDEYVRAEARRQQLTRHMKVVAVQVNGTDPDILKVGSERTNAFARQAGCVGGRNPLLQEHEPRAFLLTVEGQGLSADPSSLPARGKEYQRVVLKPVSDTELDEQAGFFHLNPAQDLDQYSVFVILRKVTGALRQYRVVDCVRPQVKCSGREHEPVDRVWEEVPQRCADQGASGMQKQL